MRRYKCDHTMPASLPHVHLSVKRAKDAVAAIFLKCYQDPLPPMWELEIEKQIWKNLLLTEHEETKHPHNCQTGWHHHCYVFAKRALRKLLASEEDERYDYYAFHFYWEATNEYGFEFECQHYF